MKWPLGALLGFCVATLPSLAKERPSKVVINPDGVLEINGKKVFHLGFDLPPLPGAKAWNGRNAIAELRDAGATFLQTGPGGKERWTDADVLKREQAWFDAAAKRGMYCWPRLKYIPKPGDAAGETEFRGVINRFKNHPAMGVWNSVDEPEWSNHPVEPLRRAYEVIRELDPNHPVSINHAPRGTLESLRRYNVACDITGADIYPVAYPPGLHGGGVFTNRELSVVGDVTRRMMDDAEGRKPVWIYLQVAWSGVVGEGKTLRFPTFPEQRFMTYLAIIAGARGIIYFGGQIPKALTPEDAKLGWNWSFWRRVLRPVVEEIGERSPLYPALVAPESKLPVQVKGNGVEFCVREVGTDIFLLACKREGATAPAAFSGLPMSVAAGEVLFESPRKVVCKDGRFTDWFAPFEVRVYRFQH
jgi:hypothetical protein